MRVATAGFLSVVIYTGISVVAAGLFLAVTLAGSYTWVARLGGAAWIFLLLMIVLMPIVTPMVKRRLGG